MVKEAEAILEAELNAELKECYYAEVRPVGDGQWTDAARTIWAERYLTKVEGGHESIEDRLWSVATDVGSAELAYNADKAALYRHEFYKMMVSRRFLPNSPTLMNAGKNNGLNWSACFPAGTMIRTRVGHKPIEDIEVGDHVLTHEGRYRPVSETMQRQGQLYKVKIDKLPYMYVTEEHPFMTQRGWVSVNSLQSKQDFVAISKSTISSNEYPILNINNHRTHDRHTKTVVTGTRVTTDIAWLLGIFIAQGSLSPGGDIRFVIGTHNQKQAERIQTLIYSTFDIEARVLEQVDPKRNNKWFTVRCHSVILAEYLEAEFGKGFNGKRLPVWLMESPIEIRKAFIRGVADGDGTKVNAQQTRITLSNEQLIRQLFDMAYEVGYYPNLSKEFMPKLGTVQPWSVSFGSNYNKGMVKDGNYRVLSVEPTDTVTTVYNFEVDEDHSYIANQVVVHNCFVLPIPDDLGGIFETQKRAALIHQSGGGTGFDFSSIRERDARVSRTQGKASGPVSFLRSYDAATETIKQGGTRRGANMAVLRVDHPDIYEFIKCKIDGGITNFNISVAATDAFMEKIIGKDPDDTFNLVSPVDGRIVKSLSASQLFSDLVDAAWASGDPGLIFIDQVNASRANPNPDKYTIAATNPCLSGDSLIYTENGMRRMVDLYNEQIAFNATVDHPNRFASSTPVFKTGTKQLYRLTTKEGYSIRLTADHKVMTDHGKVEAGKLRKGDKLRLLPHKGGFGNRGSYELGSLLGWLIADGTVVKDRAVLSFFGEKRELAESFSENMQSLVVGENTNNRNYSTEAYEIKGRDEQRIGSARFLRIAEEHGFDRSNKHHIPESLWTGSEEMIRGFLQAMFTADGTVLSQTKNNTKGVRLTSISYEMLQGVQQLLMNFGIASRIYKNRRKAGERLMPDGKGGMKLYKTQAYHELSISKDNLYRFADEIPFLLDSKQDRLLDAIENDVYEEEFYARFEELVPDAVEDVYDITVPLTSTLCSNGLVVSNCGEQALPPNDACNLGSINLTQYVTLNIAGWEQGPDGIAWKNLATDVALAVRFLDNVIDLNPIKDPLVQDQVKASRRIGLGVMGWADMLIYLGIPYGSEKARKLAKRMIKFIQITAEQATHQLAKERGVFPDWETSIYGPAGMNYERRNSTLTMMAPTGSIGILAGCSTGIEPNFGLTMTHQSPTQRERKLKLTSEAATYYVMARHPHEVSEILDYIQENGNFGGYVPSSEGYMMSTIEEMKLVLATAQEIGYMDHVLMQAAWQSDCENGISKTINMVNSATREDVAKAYKEAYLKKCRGITVFRDGCKGFDMQVLSTPAKKTEVKSGEPTIEVTVDVKTIEDSISQWITQPVDISTKRFGYTRTVVAPEGKAHITLNSDQYGVFETIIALGKNGSDIQALAEALGRMVTLHLRASTLNRRQAIADIAHQLRHIRGSGQVGFGPGAIVSLADALGFALEEYLADTAKNSEPVVALDQAVVETPKKEGKLFRSGELCPQCNNYAMVKQAGCSDCQSCGYSKC